MWPDMTALKLPEHRRQWWSQNPDWEHQRLNHMGSNLNVGDRMLYIGAEEGDMPALCATWGMDVFLVEPGDRVWANIKSIWDMNDLKPPRANYVGFCGKANSENWINGWSATWPEQSYGDVVEDHAFPWLLAPCMKPIITVDQISEKFVPTVISIDVEGAEWDVLRGAEQTLAEHHPKIYLSLHPEFLMDQYGVYGREVRDLIINKGYREKLIDYQHEVHFYYSEPERKIQIS